jgi:monofunctional biosynthetic peptidoglycan transglycosylase
MRFHVRLPLMLPAPKQFEKTPNSAYLAGRTRTILGRMGSAELP